eukprot:TRINITY_DN6789_c0_g1_i10.p1 TRINITY_DN6789_c0_g1~~TRINITY_DN6789_c0_g1_i10.p1  ORF type:complete len:268 (-),score=99.36 TRINITY_DN6789_c0_g1_i10:156-959(-)
MDNYKTYPRYCEHSYNLATPAGNKKALLQCLYAVGLFADSQFADAGRVLAMVPYNKYEEELRQILTPSDYVYYLIMSALATFSRTSLKKIDESQGVRAILEHVPELNGIIGDFLASNYKQVFARLSKVRAANSLDVVFLFKLDTLVRRIMEKSIMQYCLPYKSVDLTVMAKTLDKDIVELERNLVSMSSSGLIRAKIDSQNKVLYLESEDVKLKAFKTTLENGEKFIQELTEIILRMKMKKEGLVLKGEKMLKDLEVLRSENMDDDD